jgi:hypothetical protein
MGIGKVYTLISKRANFLGLALVSCLALLSYGLGQQQASIYIHNNGTIALRSYICGNYNSTHYYAQNTITGNYEQISTDAVQTINYAFSKLTPGRTWQETVFLKGSFSIGTTITLNQSNILLNCTQATLTLTVSTILFSVTSGSGYTFLGGHFVGPNTASTNNMVFRVMGCSSVLIDGADIRGFGGNNGGILVIGSTSSAPMTVQNCNFHDNTNSMSLNLLNAGNNKIINCVFDNPSQGIFVSATCGYNQILGCEFYGWHQGGFGHAIYMDGGSGSKGNNIVSVCNFHDPLTYAALQVKSQSNKFYNNMLSNFPQAAVGFVIWSQYNQSTANDNEVYDNTFTNMYYGIWVGHGIDCLNPTLRNKIHDNDFTNVTNCIQLNPDLGNASTSHVDDTWIYYNKFSSCRDIFPPSDSAPSLIANTVVAYNVFDATVTDLSVESYTNTLVYGNAPWMADFPTPLPSPLPIPPP